MGKNYFSGCMSLDELKVRYMHYMQRYLPREGHRGKRRLAKAVEGQYEAQRYIRGFSNVRPEIRHDFIRFQSLVKDLIVMGLEVEMCGKWLFVTGPTGQHVTRLLELGFRFSPELRRWCYRPAGFEAPDLNGVSMEYIRKKFGNIQSGNGAPEAKINPRGRGDQR